MERLLGRGRAGSVIVIGRRPRAGERRPSAALAPALSTNERMIPSPSSEPRTPRRRVSGWGIRPATLPAAFIDAGDRPQRAVRVGPVVLAAGRRAVGVDVAEQDLAVALERVERRLVGEVAALAVGDRHPQRPALAEERG